MESTKQTCSTCGDAITQEQREWGSISANERGEWSHDACFDGSSLAKPVELYEVVQEEVMTKANYVELAKAKGAECGAAAAMLGDHGDNAQTINRAAVGFVNRLPLNDIAFEKELQAIFEESANAILLVQIRVNAYNAWILNGQIGPDPCSDLANPPLTYGSLKHEPQA